MLEQIISLFLSLNLILMVTANIPIYKSCSVNNGKISFGGFSYEPTDSDFVFHNEVRILLEDKVSHDYFVYRGGVGFVSEVRKTVDGPSPRAGSACYYDDNKLYVFGGFSSFHQKEQHKDLWVYHIKENRWEKLSQLAHEIEIRKVDQNMYI